MKERKTIDELRELLSYDPSTGDIVWRQQRGKRAKAGAIAGCLCGQGYRVITIDYVSYQGHQVAWALHYGAWPEGGVDHRNLIKSDNRIGNLRQASQSQNAANTGMRKRNTSGRKGVTWNKASGKWQAGIRVKGKDLYLGLFSDLDEAHAAYCKAANENFNQFARAQ